MPDESVGLVVSVQVGMPSQRDTGEDPWFTAIFKHPVEGKVALRTRNLEGDAQADLRVHGGPHKAVMAYSAEHYPLWRAEFEKTKAEFPFGAFGENLTISGLDEERVCIGDVHQIGSARLQVSQPRSPCWKLARKWSMPDLLKKFVASGRSGWYYRVLAEGSLQRGDEVILLASPHPDWPVRRITDVAYNLRRNEGDITAMERLEELSSDWKR